MEDRITPAWLRLIALIVSILTIAVVGLRKGGYSEDILMKRKDMLHIAVAMFSLAVLILLIMALIGEAKMASLVAFLFFLFVVYTFICSVRSTNRYRKNKPKSVYFNIL